MLKRHLANSVEKIQLLLVNSGREEPKPRVPSYPYISGDLFAAAADTVALNNSEEYISLRCQASSILFVERDRLDHIDLSSLPFRHSVILIHNGDSPPTNEQLSSLTLNGSYVFSTNISRSSHSEPLPIGIENAYLRRNGSLHHYNPLHLSRVTQKKSCSTLVSFNTSTNLQVRKYYEHACAKHDLFNRLYSRNDYLRELSSSMFTISPPGNGTDCHRTWEAFYHRTVPVVERRHYLFEHIDLPVFIVDRIADYLAMPFIEKLMLYEAIVSRSYDAIYADYWLQRIRSRISPLNPTA